MTGREKSPGRENDREHYYGKDGLTKSRAVGVTILMGALLLFQLIVFLTGEPEEESGRGGEKPGKITMDEPGSRPGGALCADTLFEFNTNTISADSLVLLGFTRKQAQVVLNYRAKGGVFRRKEDFAKIYSVSAQMYERLYDYITVPAGHAGNIGVAAADSFAGKRGRKRQYDSAQEPVPERSFSCDTAKGRTIWSPPELIVELNGADSAELVRLYGIGGYYAGKIIAYRERIGNFYTPEQLMEISGIDSTRYHGFKDNVVADTSMIRKFSLDTASWHFLSAHPYIGPYAARGILLLRQRFGAEYCTLENLERERLVAPGTRAALKHYIIEK